MILQKPVRPIFRVKFKGGHQLKHPEKLRYPAIIKKDDDGTFSVYFPALFPEHGWEFPLSQGKSKPEAVKNAEKELAFTLAGFLYDNEEIPATVPIQKEQLSDGMELIEVETSMASYAEEIKEHLRGRHWHIGYYEHGLDFEAFGFKNARGLWDIFYEESEAGELSGHPDLTHLFTVKTHSEAEEKFKQFVENVILKRS